MHKGNWDDLRFVLAVAENGTVSAAARRLGVNHATVLRRIGAFEQANGLTVFTRGPQGYLVQPDKLRLIEALRDAATAVAAVGRSIRGAGAQPAATLRITATDTFCQSVLPAILPGLGAAAGADDDDLAIELSCNNGHLDLGRLDADIAVRPALALADDLSGVRAGDLGFGVYVADGGADPQTTTWLGLRGNLGRSRVAGWLADTAAPDTVRGGADSFVVLREMAAAGLGRAILPGCLGEADARLRRVDGIMPDLSVPIWVACHAEMAQVPRIRTVRSRLARALRARADVLRGPKP